jgi:hypothetical protein
VTEGREVVSTLTLRIGSSRVDYQAALEQLAAIAEDRGA